MDDGTNQHDALKLADAIENTTLNIFQDVRDMEDPDDGTSIIAHIEIAERNLAALRTMLRSPDFHVSHHATA